MSETVDPGKSVIHDSEGMHEHPVITLLQREWDSPYEVSEAAALQAQKALDTFHQREDDQQALDCLLEAVDQDPGNLECHLELLDGWGLEDMYQLPVLSLMMQLADRKLHLCKKSDPSRPYWEDPDKRAYLRVGHRLAEEYHYQGNLKAAVDLWERLRSLDPSHRLPIMDCLLWAYLQIGEVTKAEHLMSKGNKESSCASLAWGRLLSVWVKEQGDALPELYRQACLSNPTVERLILGQQEPPESYSTVYAPGSPEEAYALADAILPAWQATPRAVSYTHLRAHET